MTIKEEIVGDLRKGTPLEDIRRKYRSVGLQYEAIREYLPEAWKKVEETDKTQKSRDGAG